MQWTEQAIILSARKFGESSLLIEVFAKSKGLYSGLVRGGQSKTKLNIYQPGNIVEATWSSRLEEQLGTFAAELTDAVSSKVIHDSQKLLSLISVTSILRKTLIDRQPYNDLYEHFQDFLNNLCQSNAGAREWACEYVWMEVAILRYLGFGLDLNACAVTGKTDNLQYISPRTGRAVTAEGAKGYEERLFTLPKFMLDGKLEDNNEITIALEITEYFMAKELFSPHERKLPTERDRFVKSLSRLNKFSDAM